MNLFALPATRVTGPAPAPTWACGCFVRRAITFFTGATDTTTLVVWIQSRGLTFDLRLAPGRPRVERAEQLRELSLEDAVRLAEAEGGLAHSTFVAGPDPSSGSMDWGNWTRTQLHDGWPEPGALRRVGDCLIEFAPSGAYVEDWRARPSGRGMLIGLVMRSEIDVQSGALLHSGGGLVVAGDHAGFVRGRAASLPAATRLVDLVRAGDRDRALRDDVFGFEASYARRAAGEYVVLASTLPFREGQPLMSFDGFALDGDVLVQRATLDGRLVERRFQIETWEPYDGDPSTDALPAGKAWLEAERGTLLRNAR